jgi:hypothetical protein
MLQGTRAGWHSDKVNIGLDSVCATAYIDTVEPGGLGDHILDPMGGERENEMSNVVGKSVGIWTASPGNLLPLGHLLHAQHGSNASQSFHLLPRYFSHSSLGFFRDRLVPGPAQNLPYLGLLQACLVRGDSRSIPC